jgi:dCMP deaminase
VSRPSKHYTFLKMAQELSQQSTCIRRQVGCILVDKHFHIIGSGYNGNASGLTHCIDKPCPGYALPSGEGLDVCQAIHAEQNALMQCQNVQEIETCYCTTAPCIHCTKMLLNTGCKTIVFLEDYARSGQYLWNREWIHFRC